MVTDANQETTQKVHIPEDGVILSKAEEDMEVYTNVFESNVVAAEIYYHRNSIVAFIYQGGTDTCPLWIEKVCEVPKTEFGSVKSICVHSYERSGSTSISYSPYYPSYFNTFLMMNIKPYKDEISPRSVLLSFERLI